VHSAEPDIGPLIAALVGVYFLVDGAGVEDYDGKLVIALVGDNVVVFVCDNVEVI
jgi:hypothetical protein